MTDTSTMSRRQAMAGGAAIAGATAMASGVASASTDNSRELGGIHAIPEMAAHWQKLDLAEILTRPAAFMSVSQNKSLYEPWGAQASERQWERPTLSNTVKVAKAARQRPNFVSFNWVGYPVFRPDHPVNDFDRVQYQAWTEGLNFSEEMIAKDNELADDLKALVQPGDSEYDEVALQTAFVGTAMPLELSRKRVEVIVLTGIHLDWCIEGNARLARDNGYLPIVIGDACACVKPEQEAAAMDRINNFFAPVISSDEFVRLIGQV